MPRSLESESVKFAWSMGFTEERVIRETEILFAGTGDRNHCHNGDTCLLYTSSDCIMELEKDPENMDTINEIFRAAHSLKGMAGTMGFKRMQRLTHDMENVFQEVRSEKVKVTSSMIDLLFKCLDAIEGYLDNVKASSDRCV